MDRLARWFPVLAAVAVALGVASSVPAQVDKDSKRIDALEAKETEAAALAQRVLDQGESIKEIQTRTRAIESDINNLDVPRRKR